MNYPSELPNPIDGEVGPGVYSRTKGSTDVIGITVCDK
jgi:hypothetical protein